MVEIARSVPGRWFEANGIPPASVPADAELVVDEAAGTICVEVFAKDPDGRMMLHAGRLMTTIATYPLTVPPPPGLIDAYQHTVTRMREERRAVAGIRAAAAEQIAEHLKGRVAAADVFAALGMSPTYGSGGG